MPRRFKLLLLISTVFIFFSFSYLWLKLYTLQTKLYSDDKDDNLYERNINGTTNKVEQPEKRLPILSRNLDTISEEEKE